MSIIKSIKKAFGFPEEYDDTEYTESDSTSVTSSDSDTEHSYAAPTTEPPVEHEVDIEDMSGKRFDALIVLFKMLNPKIDKEWRSTESQRMYILSHINQ